MEPGSPSPKRPQLSVDELHQLRWLLGSVLTLLSAWSMFYLSLEAWMLMGIITLASLAGIVWPRLPSRVPAFLHTFAFPLIVAFFLGDLWLKGDTLPAIVRLDMLLLLYRGISYRQRRDDLQIIVLGLFLIVVAGVLTVSMVFAVQLLVFAACALALLLVLTLLQGAEEGVTPPARDAVPSWVDVNWPRLLARLRLAADWRVLVLGGLLFVGVVGVSALLFVLIPRFQLENSLFLERFMMRKARSGISDTIKYGDISEIQQDNTVALSVDVSDRAQVPASPYWRMLVLDQYEHGTFKLAPARNRFEEPRTDALLFGNAKSDSAVSWTFYLEAGVSRYLPLSGPFRELRFTDRQSHKFSRSLGVVALIDDPSTMTAYRVEGFANGERVEDANFAKLWADRKANPVLLQIGLEGVPASDRVTLARIAAEIAASAFPENEKKTGRVVPDFTARANAWLRGHHGYSLLPRVPGGPGDPLVRWLNSNEAGHCELFAGSLVLLARSAGFPARAAVGFHGGSWNGYSNSLTVRNSDAHAWAEIFDEEAGVWRRADALATPTAAAENATTTTAAVATRRIDRGWSARVESLRVFWYRRIVSFDRLTQLETLQAIKQGTQNSGRHLRESLAQALANLRSWWQAPWDWRRGLVVLAWLAALVAAVWAWREFGRKAWQRWLRPPGTRLPDPVRLNASRWLAQLAIDQAVPTPEEEAGVRSELQRLRFGARASWPAEPRQVFRRAQRLVWDRRRSTGRRGS